MNKNIIICILILVFSILCKNIYLEHYSNYVSDLDNTNKELNIFCGELSKLNKVDNNTILLKKYNNRLREKKEKEIQSLKKEIDDLYLNRINTEIDNNNKYRLNRNDKLVKQIDLINIAKKNIISDNNYDITIN